MTGVGSGGRTRDRGAADSEDAALKGRRYKGKIKKGRLRRRPYKGQVVCRDFAEAILAGFAAAGRKGGVRGVGDFELGDGAPEAFEIVKAPGLFGKNVNDEAAEIEQSPIGGALAFAMFGFAPQFLV